jgi:uncharacterized membrane protein (DUF4010 family)
VQVLDFEFLLRIGVALALGALIGLERERQRDTRTVLAGIRTYPLAALGGVLFAYIGLHLESPAYIAVGAAVFGVATAMLYWVRHTLGIHGITSPVAFLVTYLVGALIGLGFLLEGVIAGIAVTVLLFTKDRLHRLAEVMTKREMAGALQFTVVAFILFPIVMRLEPPLLGQDWIGRGAILDPYFALLIVIFVSVLSFASFLIMRFMGPSHGLAISGMLGGLVNSEATAGSLAGIARERNDLMGAAIEGVTLTNATMLLRNLAIATFVDPTLTFLRLIAPALIIMFLIQTGFYLLRRRRFATMEGSVRLGNPFALGPAVRFALVFLVIQIFSVLVQRLPRTGEGVVLLTALGGLVSSAAVVASVGTLAAQGELSLPIATITAVTATLLSTLVKLVLVRGVHRPMVPPLLPRMILPAMIGAVVLGITLILL